MEIVIALLIIYILLFTLVYFRVSKLNKSYLNSYTLNFVSAIIIRLFPLILGVGLLSFDINVLILFVAILYISLIGSYLGYEFGFKIAIPGLNIPVQQNAKSRYNSYLVFSIIVMVFSFILLGASGVGVSQWIFHNRTAYIEGRSGNGIWYILYELSILISAIFILCIAKNRNNKRIYLLYIIPVIAAFFSGSKGFLLGVIILFILFYDCYEKRIKFRTLVLAGIAGLLLLVLLLQIQSNISLLDYSDYYYQFIRFLEYTKQGNWEFAFGNIQFEEILWNLVPRSLYPDKPYVYGQIRIVNIFFDYESIAKGNTPSFSEFIVPYADFGIVGVFLSFFAKGFVQGFIEKKFRENALRYGSSFNVVFVYVLLYIISPVNFSLVYLILFGIILYYIQKIRWLDLRSNIVRTSP